MSDGLIEHTELLQRLTLLKRELAGIDIRFCVGVQLHNFCRDDNILLTVRRFTGRRIVRMARVMEWGKHLEGRARGRQDEDLTDWVI